MMATTRQGKTRALTVRSRVDHASLTKQMMTDAFGMVSMLTHLRKTLERGGVVRWNTLPNRNSIPLDYQSRSPVLSDILLHECPAALDPVEAVSSVGWQSSEMYSQ